MYTLVPLDTHTLTTPSAFIPPVTTVSLTPIPLPSGATSYQVTGCNFPSVPKSIVLTIRKALITDDNISAEPVGSPTTDGQTFSLVGGPLINANYTATWVANL